MQFVGATPQTDVNVHAIVERRRMSKSSSDVVTFDCDTTYGVRECIRFPRLQLNHMESRAFFLAHFDKIREHKPDCYLKTA